MAYSGLLSFFKDGTITAISARNSKKYKNEIIILQLSTVEIFLFDSNWYIISNLFDFHKHFD